MHARVSSAPGGYTDHRAVIEEASARRDPRLPPCAPLDASFARRRRAGPGARLRAREKPSATVT